MTTEKNQNDNHMETTTETTLKTAMISTGSATHETVLQIVKEHKIDYTELGKDQKENTVIQLSYKDEQQPLIDDIQLMISFIEDAIALFTPIAIKFLKSFGKEAESALQKLQDKYADKKLLALGKQKKTHSKSKLDGNTEGK